MYTCRGSTLHGELEVLPVAGVGVDKRLAVRHVLLPYQEPARLRMYRTNFAHRG
jgi:hypothetical protein